MAQWFQSIKSVVKKIFNMHRKTDRKLASIWFNTSSMKFKNWQIKIICTDQDHWTLPVAQHGAYWTWHGAGFNFQVMEIWNSIQTARSKSLALIATHIMCLTSTDLSLTKWSVARGSRRLDVLLGTQCIDFLIISPSCFAGDFCSSKASRSIVNHLTAQIIAHYSKNMISADIYAGTAYEMYFPFTSPPSLLLSEDMVRRC